MNFQKSTSISVILLTALVFLSSCATTTQQIQHVSEGQIIDMGSCTVAAPPGKNWEVKTEKEKGSIQFHKFKKNLFGQIIGGTVINIFQDMPAPNDINIVTL